MSHCLRHVEEPLADHCRSCGHPFCTRCLVWAFGATKPPYCVGCALSASGVRPGARPPVVARAAEPAAAGDQPVVADVKLLLHTLLSVRMHGGTGDPVDVSHLSSGSDLVLAVEVESNVGVGE